MSVVEQEYRKRVDAMSPVDKMHRMEQLLNWTRELIARQVRLNKGNVSDEQIKWEVCLRMYGDDPRFRKLLQQRDTNAPC